MKVDDLAGEDIDEAADVKVAIFARDVAVLDVKLPKLIRACYLPVAGKTSVALLLPTPLRQAEAMGLADAVHLLVIDDQVIVSAEIEGELAVAALVAKKFQGAVTLHKGNNGCVTGELLVPGSMRMASFVGLGILMPVPGRFAEPGIGAEAPCCSRHSG